MEQIVQLKPLIRYDFFRSYHVLVVGLVLFSLLCGIGLWLFPPLLVFAITNLLVLCVLMICYPYLGILVYLVVEYARVPEMFPLLQTLQIGKIVVLVTGLIWLGRSVSARKLKSVSDPLNWIMVIWALIVIASSFFAMNSKLANQGVIDFLKWVLIYFLIINLVDTLPKWQGFMWVLLFLNFKMSQFQIRQFLAGYAIAPSPELFIVRGIGAGSTGFFSNAGDFGVAMCVVAPLAFYLIKAVKSKVLKVGGMIFFFGFVFSILKCGSRGAPLALLVMTFFFWLKSSKKFQNGILILLFVIGSWASAPEAWKGRFVSATDYQQDSTASQRVRLWEAGLKMSIDNPLLGVGINNFSTNYATRYHAKDEAGILWAPHNIFIQAGSELGVLGLLSLVLAMFLVFKRNHETRRLCRQNSLKKDWISDFACALDLGLIGYIVSGSFLTVLYYPHLYIIMVLAISLNQIAKKQIIAEKNLIKDDKK
ncbi:MAG: O-antigen ligase family protein [Candidatus Zixiibacteriota bacterium]